MDDNSYDEGYRAGMQRMREVGQSRIEELEAERDEIKAKTAWQPIETAPKDGTRIRAYFPDWVESDKSLNAPAPGQIETFWACHDAFGMWVTPGRTSSDERKPTHWMPYPNPPSQN